ncbi:MAG: hypothetical protein ACK56I_27770, partial [bacterium]
MAGCWSQAPKPPRRLFVGVALKFSNRATDRLCLVGLCPVSGLATCRHHNAQAARRRVAPRPRAPAYV